MEGWLELKVGGGQLLVLGRGVSVGGVVSWTGTGSVSPGTVVRRRRAPGLSAHLLQSVVVVLIVGHVVVIVIIRLGGVPGRVVLHVRGVRPDCPRRPRWSRPEVSR